VKDNGVGIPSDKLHKIFIPFFRGPDGGHGIGLSTVQKAVRLYGGWIRAYNDDGACFEFVIMDWPDSGT
jgi:signal transduction histidine kinase